MGYPSLLQHLARRMLAFTVVCLLVTLVSCNQQPASDREVWAEVDGKPIYRDQVERYYRSRASTSSEPTSPEQALSFKLNILSELINNQILVAHASRARVTVSEAEVDTKIQELESPYSKEEFQKKLAEQGLDAGTLRGEVRQSLIINKLINKEIVARLNVNDEDVANYYESNKGTFNVPETQYRLAQIAVTPIPEPQVRNTKNDDAKNPTAAQRKIQALYARIRSGEDFTTVAQEYSEDPRTASGGGDMGFIPASAIDSNPVLRQVVAKLRPGEVSEIFRTSDGYHIVKLLGREEAGLRKLSDPEVRSSIRQMLMNEREQLLKAAYLEDLRTRAKVVNHLAGKVQNAAANPALIK